MTRLPLLLLVACGSSSRATHDAPSAIDAPAGPDALVPVPTYGAAPDQVIPPPNAPGDRYGLVVALSADGLTLATFDVQAVYAFTRASTSVPFPSSPNITLQPAGLPKIGYGLSVSADGSLLVTSAVTTTDNQLEILVYHRQGATYDTSPDILPMPPAPFGILMTAMAPDASELVYDDANDDLSILPRAGSSFSTTPSQTIPKPVAASGSPAEFASSGSLSYSGSTMAIADPGSNGVGAVFVFAGTTVTQTLTPATPDANFGSSAALRSDARELVEGHIFDAGDIGVYERDGSGYSRIQTVAAPAGAGNRFGLSTSLASDGTLAATDGGGSLYIFAPH